MVNAYQILRLPESLTLQEEDLRAAFREAGKKIHPDAGGEEEAFAALKEALATLTSPSKRLQHWLALRGISIQPRGMISSSLMDLFGQISAIIQQAEATIRKRDAAQSALAKALLEPDLQQQLLEVENIIASVDHSISSEINDFEAWEKTLPTSDLAAEKVRNLAFLEKWKNSLRSLYSRML